MIWLLAIACAVGSAVTGWRDLRPAYRAARFHLPYSYGVTPLGPTPYGEGRWMAQRGVAVVDPGGHRTLVARVVVPHEDAATRPVRVVVSGRGGIVCLHDAVDATAYECRLPVPPNQWPMVRVDISRPWQTAGGTKLRGRRGRAPRRLNGGRSASDARRRRWPPPPAGAASSASSA